MQVTETLSDGLKRAFTVVVPAADMEQKRSAKLTELGKTVRLPGFRPGKIPPVVLKQRFGPSVSAEVLEQSVNEATQQVLADRGLRPAAQPKVALVTSDPTRDVQFNVELEVLPDIPMPDFAAISLIRPKAEVSEEAISTALGNIAARQRKVEDLDEVRPAVTGDILTVDYTGFVDGTAFPGGTGTDADIEIGGGGFIPGFTEQMEGLSPGETRTIDVTFPDPYQAAELAGKAAQFEIVAKKLRRALVPAVDDALATAVGFESLEELRGVISKQMQREYDSMSRLKLKRQLMDALTAVATYSVPEAMVDYEFDTIWRQVEANRNSGKIEEGDAGKDDDTLKAEYRAIAERRVQLGLMLTEVGRNNGITVGQEEMLRAMRQEAARYPGQEQQVMEFFRKNPQAAEGLRGPIFEEKVVDFVLELARIEDQPVTPEELAAEPPAP
jgi:trigger factor